MPQFSAAAAVNFGSYLRMVSPLSPNHPQVAPGRSSPDRDPPPDLFESTLDCISTANLDDLQQSWETLKNVVSAAVFSWDVHDCSTGDLKVLDSG